jgi:hypothetical protein
MHAYVDAQQDFYRLNHTWAQKIISSDGKKDGLYWPAAPGEAPSPLGPAFSPAEPGEGYHGYRFRIIQDGDGQGFALLAWPVEWGKTGMMSFMINQNDEVYQANLGMRRRARRAPFRSFRRIQTGRPSINRKSPACDNAAGPYLC